jgi:hypothetical protein
MKVAIAKRLTPGQRVRYYYKHDSTRTEYWGSVKITNLGKLDIEPEFIKEGDLEYLEPAKNEHQISNYA